MKRRFQYANLHEYHQAKQQRYRRLARGSLLLLGAFIFGFGLGLLIWG